MQRTISPVKCLHGNRGNAVKPFYLSSKLAGFLLLNILLCANIARGQLTVNPSSINFGSVPAGTSSSQTLMLGNSGKSDLTVSQVSLIGQSFSLRGPALPLTLSAGQNTLVSIVFAPLSGGSASGSLSLVSSTTSVHDRSGKHNTVSATTNIVSLSGTGVTASTASPTTATLGVLVAHPSSVAFAGVQVRQQSITVSNSHQFRWIDCDHRASDNHEQ